MIKKITLFTLMTLQSVTSFCADSGPTQHEANMGYVTESYDKIFRQNITLGANATGSFQIINPVSKFNLYLEQSASFTFNTATKTVYIASQTSQWEGHEGSRTLELQPEELSSGTFIWFDNGGVEQIIRFKSYGRQNYKD